MKHIAATLCAILVAWASASGQNPAAESEYWAQLNKDGHWRNSNDRPLEGPLRVRWSKTLLGFSIADRDSDSTYQRSNNLSVRHGKIALIIPNTEPAANFCCGYSGHYATIGMYSLGDGSLVHQAITPAYGAGGLYTSSRLAIMDSDTPAGLINQYWTEDGRMYVAWGGDHNGSYEFNPYTGEIPFGSTFFRPGLTTSTFKLTNGANHSGYFAMTNANPLLWARGGGITHDTWGQGSAGVSSQVLKPLLAFKHYAPFVVDGSWVYGLGVTNILSTSVGYGVRIQGNEATSSPAALTARWTYTDPNKGILTTGVHHANGAPRAFTLGEDGRLYYVGYWTVGAGTTQAPDFSRGIVLTGVPTAGSGSTHLADRTIPLPWFPLQECVYCNKTTLPSVLLPQIATKGAYVVVFEPYQASATTPGHLFVVNTQTQVVSTINFPSGYYTTNSRTSFAAGGQLSPEHSTKLVIAGDSAYLVEPSMVGGALSLKVDKVVLATMARTTTVLTPGVTIPTGTRAVAMRDLAAVDGALVALVDLDIKHQALVVIEGSTTPQADFIPHAVISAPLTGIPLFGQVLADDVVVPTNQFSTGQAIAFASQGSLDPDGGSLSYRWDFGDGTGSTEPNPTHTYLSSSPGQTSPRTVTLTVTDNEGHASSPATLALSIKDIGAARVTALPAVADSWVDLRTTGLDKTHGADTLLTVGNRYLFDGLSVGPTRGFLQFDLGTVAPSSIRSARLRLSTASYIPYGPHKMLVRGVSTQWAEATITGRSAPPPGEVLGEKQFAARIYAQSYIEVPIPTAYLQTVGADHRLAFELELVHPTASLAAPSFQPSTREGTSPPQLVLEVSDGVPPPAPTPTPTWQSSTAPYEVYRIGDTGAPTKIRLCPTCPEYVLQP